MSTTAEELYKDYWVNSAEAREKRAYYSRLYGRLMPKLKIEKGVKVLDVAGGDGQFLRYMGIEHADILDISSSGLEIAKKSGFGCIQGDIEKRFPIAEESYDVALCFEVLEHLHRPNKTIVEVHNILKPGGVLYVGQPNMRADGVYHVRRYYKKDLVDDLDKAGFKIEWMDYVPAYSMPEAILSDIRKNPSWVRKAIQCVNLTLSLLPYGVRYFLAKAVPDRFALILVAKAVKS